MLLLRRAVDLVITDATMPIVDGPELLHTLRLRGDGTPAILMSARGWGTDGLTGVSFLAKPFDADTLLTLVDRRLGTE
jgi:DNA-binding response OmpR family regulator